MNDRPVDGQSRALTERQREETPLASTIEETSFVYQGKRGFLLSEALDCGIINLTVWRLTEGNR